MADSLLKWEVLRIALVRIRVVQRITTCSFELSAGLIMAIHIALRKRGYDPVALSPWYFPSVEEYRDVSEFHVIFR